MRNADLNARRIAADAYLKDFSRRLSENWGHPFDYQEAALRLSQHLRQLLEALDAQEKDGK
jgi:uncharacterized protein YigA (DUF484 family)